MSPKAPNHVAKLGEITGKTRVLYSELGEITGKTRVLPGGYTSRNLLNQKVLSDIQSHVMKSRTNGGTVWPRPRCLGLYNHVNFDVYLFLTGVREVTEPSDTSTAIGHWPYLCLKVWAPRGPL